MKDIETYIEDKGRFGFAPFMAIQQYMQEYNVTNLEVGKLMKLVPKEDYDKKDYDLLLTHLLTQNALYKVKMSKVPKIDSHIL